MLTDSAILPKYRLFIVRQGPHLLEYYLSESAYLFPKTRRPIFLRHMPLFGKFSSQAHNEARKHPESYSVKLPTTINTPKVPKTLLGRQPHTPLSGTRYLPSNCAGPLRTRPSPRFGCQKARAYASSYPGQWPSLYYSKTRKNHSS